MTYKIVSKYIKDLSFKIPGAKSYFLLEKNIRNYRIKVDVTSKKLKEKIEIISIQNIKEFSFNISRIIKKDAPNIVGIDKYIEYFAAQILLKKN